MVILFSNRKNKIEKEIIEILSANGGDYISDKAVSQGKGLFTVISEYKKTELNIENGIAVLLDDSGRFENQIFPKGTIGICEDENLKALSIFKKNNIPVVSCGICGKNTVTLSSLNSDTLFACLQRTLTDNNGKTVDPAEFKIKLSKKYSPFSVMACSAVLLLCGIKPEKF